MNKAQIEKERAEKKWSVANKILTVWGFVAMFAAVINWKLALRGLPVFLLIFFAVLLYGSWQEWKKTQTKKTNKKENKKENNES